MKAVDSRKYTSDIKIGTEPILNSVNIGLEHSVESLKDDVDTLEQVTTEKFKAIENTRIADLQEMALKLKDLYQDQEHLQSKIKLITTVLLITILLTLLEFSVIIGLVM